MAKRALANKKTLVDPLFSPPPGSEDEFVFSREGTDGEIIAIGDGFSDDGDFIDEFDDEFDEGYPDDDDEFTLDVPQDFEVISQILRRAPGGQQVVDVVIEAEEIEGATNYEIQVVKT
jgi:hypothetical protein